MGGPPHNPTATCAARFSIVRRMQRSSLVIAVISISTSVAAAETFHVAPTGSDTAPGTLAAPWRTVQHAADVVGPGDTVTVHAGTYLGFALDQSGTASAPIAFIADGVVRIDGAASADRDAIHIAGASYVRIEGFTVTGAARSGISALDCSHVTIRGNKVDQNAKWGIFTAFCDDLVIENNEASRSAQQHGIYTSNSADRPVIRGNKIWGNAMCGIHMNGDVTFGGDGVISDAVVEDNLIYDNGRSGGSAINGDGVVRALIRNNVLDTNHASGISLYRIDGGAPSTANRVINNTVRQAQDGRATINIQDGSTGNLLRNNILIHPSPSRLVLDLCPACRVGFTSDHNAVVGTWQSPADTGSFASTQAALFASSTDLSLSATSPAIDAGVATDAPARDIAGTPRPQGAAVDLGAYEHCTGPCVTGEPPGGDDPPDNGGDDGRGGDGDGGPEDPGDPFGGTMGVDEPADEGGCATAGGAHVGAALAAVAALARRRRARGR